MQLEPPTSTTLPTEDALHVAVLAAAHALDNGDAVAAVAHLSDVPLVSSDVPTRLVVSSLWKPLLSQHLTSRTGSGQGLRETKQALGAIEAACVNAHFVWNAYRAMGDLEKAAGPTHAAALVATVLWDRILEADEALFTLAFHLFFRGQPDLCVPAWKWFLTERPEYVPSYWQYLLVMKANTAAGAEPGSSVDTLLAELNRQDLSPLFAVYRMQQTQSPVATIVAAAAALKDATHRDRVAEYMVTTGFAPDDIYDVAKAFPKLTGDGPESEAAQALMCARLAAGEQRWKDAEQLSGVARRTAKLKITAGLVHANALAHLSECAGAHAVLDEILETEGASIFEQAQATFLRVTTLMAEAGVVFPESAPPRAFEPTPGRPLAQSLWIGPRLRWIEHLAIKSYLDNGWRFQLYTYENVENVPDGCEILDASSIIPEREIFREGTGSGLHAGSVGGFSDLFRYRLLADRGGMWTDTDVVNLQRFDPDGCRFVSTEWTDAGFVTLNGAIMAAPAGDPFVERAYERASELLATNEMFFTRIGPYLIAELIVEMGVSCTDIAPMGFLSPIGPMNTSVLFGPHAALAGRPDFKNALNLHVYTEVWRVLGLGPTRPPAPEAYLGHLYARHCGEEVPTDLVSP